MSVNTYKTQNKFSTMSIQKFASAIFANMYITCSNNFSKMYTKMSNNGVQQYLLKI